MSDEVPRTEWTPQVVRIADIRKHENADTLGIVDVFGCYPVVVKLGEHLPGDLVGYIPVDSDCDTTRPEFAFLAPRARASGKHRLRAMKLRGTFSQGLLMQLPNDRRWSEGDSVVEVFGLEKYIPPSERDHVIRGIQATKKARRSETWPYEKDCWEVAACLATIVALISFAAKSGYGLLAIPVLLASIYAHIRIYRKNNRRPNVNYYDIDSLLRHSGELIDGEEVVLTEKLHGSNAAFVHTGKKYHAKSRTVFRDLKPLPSDNGQWGFSFSDTWAAITRQYGLEEKLAKYPGIILRGEIVGPAIQKGFHYSNGESEVSFYAFDAEHLETRKYMSYDDLVEFCKSIDVPMCPLLYRGPWSDELRSMANGKSTIASHTREGFVVKCATERHSDVMGRVNLKLVGQDYLLTKTEDEE